MYNRDSKSFYIQKSNASNVSSGNSSFDPDRKFIKYIPRYFDSIYGMDACYSSSFTLVRKKNKMQKWILKNFYVHHHDISEVRVTMFQCIIF